MKIFKRFLVFILGAHLFMMLSGCESIGDFQAPVIEGFSQSPFNGGGKKKAGDYQVKRGDTLYSIAWANNLDYRTLAEINQLNPPYRIYAGQYLKVRPGFFESLSRVFRKEKPIARVKPVQREPIKLVKVASTKPVYKETVRYEVIKPKKTIERSVPKSQAARLSVAYPKKSISVKGWMWPADGQVVQGYSENVGGNKGVDIAGSYGGLVRAAASGKVVYSGSGLKGYGQLLLIKHNNSYLSAYAYNKRLLVKEGDEVVAGQKIAEMGRNNHGQVRLHFEIRHNGQPVNPRIYLR